MGRDRILVILGPTAVGKTDLSIDCALRFGGEVVSCDSMQLYRGMRIGSAMPTEEEQARVPHHLVGEIDPREPFSAARFQTLARAAVRDILDRGKLPVVCGGTGLYLNALLYDMDFSAPPRAGDQTRRMALQDLAEREGPEALHARLAALDPAAADRIHPHNIRRVIRAIEAAEGGQPLGDFSKDLSPVSYYDAVLVGLTRDRQELYDRIDRRVDLMMDAGLAEEVQGLLNTGLTAEDISMKGIGYKEVIGFLHGEYDQAEAVRLIKRNTRHLAKRQMTWFKRLPGVTWYDLSGKSGGDSFVPAVRASKTQILEALAPAFGQK